MEQIIGIAFEKGMTLALGFGFVGFIIGLCMNLLNNYGRG